mgnify:CR=1 FL=1
MKAQQNSQYLTEQLGLDTDQQKKLEAPMKSATEKHDKLVGQMKSSLGDHQSNPQSATKTQSHNEQGTDRSKSEGGQNVSKVSNLSTTGTKNQTDVNIQRENGLAVDSVVKELNQAIDGVLKGDQKQKFTQIKEAWTTKFKG